MVIVSSSYCEKLRSLTGQLQVHTFVFRTSSIMIESLLGLTKSNNFVNPFVGAKCSVGEGPGLPKSRVIPSRNIAFAATGNQN